MAGERIAMQHLLYGRTAALLHFVFVRSWPRDLPAFAIDPGSVQPLYNDPLEFGLRCAGHPPVSPFAVADQDVVNAMPCYGIACDIGEYKLIGNALGSFVQTDETVSVRSQSWGAMATRFESRRSALEALYKSRIPSMIAEVGMATTRLPIGVCGGSEFDPGYYQGY